MHGSSLKYAWLSDGTLASVRTNDGAGNGVAKRYQGSFVYTSNGGHSTDEPTEVESIAWDEGRIFYNNSVASDLPEMPAGLKGGDPVMPDSLAVADSAFVDFVYRDCWFAGDHLGNVRTVIDITTDLVVPEILEQNDYLPFGTRIQSATLTTVMDNRWRYAGKEAQRFGTLDLGLLNFGARMYDPFIARWTAVDPMANAFSSVCPFSYCGGDSINHLDPNGNWVWVAVGVAIEYGSQVYNNIQNGKTGYDAWVGDVNFVRVGLSAINPGKKLFLAKTILVEGTKAAVSYTPNGGLSINNNVEDVAKETIKNTAIDATVGKVLDASSPQAVETTAEEASNAAKRVSSASHKASRNPSSPKAATALSEAEGKASSSGAQAAGTRALNNTIGANPEATKATIKIVNKALENETDKQRKY